MVFTQAKVKTSNFEKSKSPDLPPMANEKLTTTPSILNSTPLSTFFTKTSTPSGHREEIKLSCLEKMQWKTQKQLTKTLLVYGSIWMHRLRFLQNSSRNSNHSFRTTRSLAKMTNLSFLIICLKRAISEIKSKTWAQHSQRTNLWMGQKSFCLFRYNLTILLRKMYLKIKITSRFLDKGRTLTSHLMIKNKSDLPMIYCSKRWGKHFKIRKWILCSQISRFQGRKVFSKITEIHLSLKDLLNTSCLKNLNLNSTEK